MSDEWQWMDVESLTEDPDNVRMHSERNLDMIAGSLREFGQVETLVVNRAGKVLAGNGRLHVMRQEGTERAYCRVVDLTPDQERALAIALNRTGDSSHFDHDALTRQLDELAAEAPELLSAAGFTDADREAMREMAWEHHEAEPPESEPSQPEPSNRTLRLSADAYHRIMRSIEACKASSKGAPSKPDGDILAGICDEWFDRDSGRLSDTSATR